MPTMSFDVPAIKTLAFETIDGGVLATADGLVLTGEAKGDLSAIRCKTGKVCGPSAAARSVNAPPVSYAVDGKPYVALAAAGTLWAWEWRTSGVPCAIGCASLLVVIACKEPGT